MSSESINTEFVVKAAAYCSTSEHCVSEVADKLQKWGAEQCDIDTIIKYLCEEQYIDEHRYCKAFVNDKLRFAKWGRRKITYMLSAKHVDKKALAEALDAIDEDLYISILTDLLRSKLRSLRSVAPEQQKLKLYSFAASRGFESSAIAAAIKQL